MIALAVGNLESREIGPRSSVWSEPEMVNNLFYIILFYFILFHPSILFTFFFKVEKGAYEFANTEKYLKAGEDYLTPYIWDR